MYDWTIASLRAPGDDAHQSAKRRNAIFLAHRQLTCRKSHEVVLRSQPDCGVVG